MNDDFSLALICSVDELRRVLSEQHKKYLLATNLPATKVELQFEGKLEAEPVAWNARIWTIDEFSKLHRVTEDPNQFIDIKIVAGAHLLEVGLNIAQIDQAAIERTIIMVRNYKRLRPGRHEYGAKSKTL